MPICLQLIYTAGKKMQHFLGIWSKISFKYDKISHNFFMYFFDPLTKISLQWQNFPGMRFPDSTLFPGMNIDMFKCTLIKYWCLKYDRLPKLCKQYLNNMKWFKLNYADCNYVFSSSGIINIREWPFCYLHYILSLWWIFIQSDNIGDWPTTTSLMEQSAQCALF